MPDETPDDLLTPECSFPVFRGITDLDSTDPRSVKAGVVLTQFRNAMKYEPVCFALNAVVERLIFGDVVLPQEIEDAKKALIDAGFRSNWETRDFLPGVYGYPEDDEPATTNGDRQEDVEDGKPLSDGRAFYVEDGA